MSTKIKMYAVEGTVLYVCRFPANLDLKTAVAKGWRKKSFMQKVYPGINLDDIAILLPTPKLKTHEQLRAEAAEKLKAIDAAAEVINAAPANVSDRLAALKAHNVNPTS